MVTFPCAKVNLGLNIVERRTDGYHNLETVFFPIPLYDRLEITEADEEQPSDVPCMLTTTGDAILCNPTDNLVVKAYKMLAADYPLPRIHVHLDKQIPSQAGLGGGSSDAAFMLRLLNEQFHLNLTTEALERYASRLGADCAFFIKAEPCYATGIGDIMTPIDGLREQLSGWNLAVIKPPVAVSTGEAYASIVPQKPVKCCKEIVKQPVETWRQMLTNDFEAPVFLRHPELARIKQTLYDLGATYALMSGSGSALYGLFQTMPQDLDNVFPECRVKVERLKC